METFSPGMFKLLAVESLRWLQVMDAGGQDAGAREAQGSSALGGGGLSQ